LNLPGTHGASATRPESNPTLPEGLIQGAALIAASAHMAQIHGVFKAYRIPVHCGAARTALPRPL